VFGIAESAFSLIPLPVHEEKCSLTIHFFEKSTSAADAGFWLIVNPDAPAKYLVSANPPVDATTIVPNLIAVTSDCLD
jgi:hypothetical protein